MKCYCFFLYLLSIWPCYIRSEESTFSEVRRLSGLHYARQRNMRIPQSRFKKRQPFLWESKFYNGDQEEKNLTIGNASEINRKVNIDQVVISDHIKKRKGYIPGQDKSVEIMLTPTQKRISFLDLQRKKKFRRRRLKKLHRGRKVKPVKSVHKVKIGHKKSMLNEVDNQELQKANDNHASSIETINSLHVNHSFHTGEIDSAEVFSKKSDIKKFYLNTTLWKLSIYQSAMKNYSQDYNECLHDNGGCDGLCINIPGSYLCHCPPGFKLHFDGKRCIDINECFIRNGHGPCEGNCINTWGSFKCDCTLVEGTQLAEDKRTCRPIDSCRSANCSHGCVATRAGPFCICPMGYSLGLDWKTCSDNDECEDETICSATSRCINTIGSFLCS